VILAGSCASSALKIWIDSEDRFGTQSPKFQVQSTGGRVFQSAYVFSFDMVSAIFLAQDFEIVIVLT